ncbi:MAG TPA: 50S ribosomal protein L1 [Burkholderiales bacterium]
MARVSKRMKALRAKFDFSKAYPVDEALALLKQTASAKFDESVDVAVNLGIDARKSDQTVRGTAVMPRGTGKTVRVAVFAEGAAAEAAKKAGADIVGFQDLADRIKQGQIDFDLVIATPEAMRIVGALGQILGPRGLMPNPKVGTVTPNVAKAVENAKAGQVQYRADKAGIVHCSIGKASFDVDALKENLLSLVAALNRSRPAAAKGTYLKRITLSTTMGPGVQLDVNSLG